MVWAYAALATYQVISGAQQAEAMRDQARFNRQIDALNEKYALYDAYKMDQQGESAAARYQSAIDATIGTQRVAMASQNVDVSFGTAAALQAETKLTGFLNQIDIRNQAHAKAMGYKYEAYNRSFQSQMSGIQSEAQARATERAALFGGAATALQGFSGYGKKPDTNTTASGGGLSGGYGSNYLGGNRSLQGE